MLVAIKPVPNPDEKVKIRKDGSGIVLDNIKMVINPFCEIAVEEALRANSRCGRPWPWGRTARSSWIRRRIWTAWASPS
jgi:hypothetical protein